MAFGVYPDVSLADAQRTREEARKLVANGVDPREHKRAVKVEQAKEILLSRRSPESGMQPIKNGRKIMQSCIKSLEDNLFPAIGNRNIAELKPEIY